MTDKKLFGEIDAVHNFYARASRRVTTHWLSGNYGYANYRPYTTFGEFARGAVLPISSFVLNLMVVAVSTCVGILSAVSLGIGAAIYGAGKLFNSEGMQEAGSNVATYSAGVGIGATIDCIFSLVTAFLNSAMTTAAFATSSYSTVAGWLSKDSKEDQNTVQCAM